MEPNLASNQRDDAFDNAPSIKNEFVIQDVSGWILRIGVALSVLVMVAGLALSFAHRSPSIREMETTRFNASPSVIWHGIMHGHGVDVIELGILLLVLTPISRVAMSVVLFAFYDHDWIYTVVTLVVLLLTLASLFLLR